MLEASAALVAEGARLARSARPTLRLAYPLIVGPLAARIALRLTRRKPAIDVELRASGWGPPRRTWSGATSRRPSSARRSPGSSRPPPVST
ncbi:hypothetical protein ACFQX6_40335 [Streptosporangium lutulentum]